MVKRRHTGSGGGATPQRDLVRIKEQHYQKVREEQARHNETIATIQRDALKLERKKVKLMQRMLGVDLSGSDTD